MKKLLSLFLVLTIVVSIITCVPVFAATQSGTVTGTSITWSYDEATKVLTLSGTGMTPHKPLTEVGVTSTIATTATKIVVGEGIDYLGYEFLKGFTKVTEIEFPSTLTRIDAGEFIDWTAFSGTFTIPKTVATLGGYTLQNNSKINSVVFEDGRTRELKLIKDTFKQMAGLTNVYLPENVTIDTTDTTTSSSTGAYTKRVTSVATLFSGNTNPANVVIWTVNPDIIEIFESFDDYESSGITVSMLPDGVDAYGGIPGLPKGYWTFTGDTLDIYGEGDWTGSYYANPHPWSELNYSTIKKVVFHNGITSIASNFAGRGGENLTPAMSAIEEVVFPNALVTVKAFAFGACSKLADISYFNAGETTTTAGLPEGLETLEQQAFQGCKLNPFKNNALIIPASVKSIGKQAFTDGDRTSVQNIIFAKGSKIETIGESAFSNRWSVTAVEIPASITSIGNKAFFSTGSGTLKVYFEGSKPTIGTDAFKRSGDGADVKVICYQDGFAASDFGDLSYLTVQKFNPVLASGLTLNVGDTEVTASVTFRAPAAMAENQDYILIIAAYDDENTLVDVNIDTEGTIEADTTSIENGVISKTISNVSGATKYKAFFWDSLEGCTPITEAK